MVLLLHSGLLHSRLRLHSWLPHSGLLHAWVPRHTWLLHTWVHPAWVWLASNRRLRSWPVLLRHSITAATGRSR